MTVITKARFWFLRHVAKVTEKCRCLEASNVVAEEASSDGRNVLMEKLLHSFAEPCAAVANLLVSVVSVLSFTAITGFVMIVGTFLTTLLLIGLRAATKCFSAPGRDEAAYIRRSRALYVMYTTTNGKAFLNPHNVAERSLSLLPRSRAIYALLVAQQLIVIVWCK